MVSDKELFSNKATIPAVTYCNCTCFARHINGSAVASSSDASGYRNRAVLPVRFEYGATSSGSIDEHREARLPPLSIHKCVCCSGRSPLPMISKTDAALKTISQIIVIKLLLGLTNNKALYLQLMTKDIRVSKRNRLMSSTHTDQLIASYTMA